MMVVVMITMILMMMTRMIMVMRVVIMMTTMIIMMMTKMMVMMMMMMMMMMVEVAVMEGSCKTHHCSIWVSATNPDLSSSSTSKRVLRSTRQKFLSQSIFRRNVLNCMVGWEGCLSK